MAGDDRLDRVDPGSVPRTTWRSEIRGASGANVLLAAWLMLSPWILGYRDGDPTWPQFVLASAVALLAILRVTAAWWESWMSWASATAAIALFLLGAAVADSGQATVNLMAGGAVALLLAALSATATESAKGPPDASGPTRPRWPGSP